MIKEGAVYEGKLKGEIYHNYFVGYMGVAFRLRKISSIENINNSNYYDITTLKLPEILNEYLIDQTEFFKEDQFIFKEEIILP